MSSCVQHVLMAIRKPTGASSPGAWHEPLPKPSQRGLAAQRQPPARVDLEMFARHEDHFLGHEGLLVKNSERNIGRHNRIAIGHDEQQGRRRDLPHVG